MAALQLGVLISGRGSNLQALIDACACDDFPARIAVVISNRPAAKGLKRAESAGIPTAVIDHRDYEDRDSFERGIDKVLVEAQVQLVCLAGFMRLLNPSFVKKWKGRLINIHPSLLPAYKGLHTHDRVIEDGVRFTGCTVHFVTPETDDGPIIIQAAVPVAPGDTASTLAKKVLEFEHRIYPEAVRLIADGSARISGQRVKIAKARAPDDGITNPIVAKTTAP